MKQKKITIKDVAQLSGVSITTVSNILNQNTDRFTEATIQKVLAARDQLSYEPDYLAQRMVMKKSQTIGVLVPDVNNPFFSQLIKGIETILYEHQFVTLLCNADQDEAKETQYLKELERRGVDGYIIASSMVTNTAIDEIIRRKNHPYIVIDQKQADAYSDAVLIDDWAGGQLAAQHLKDCGHERIAMIFPAHPTKNVNRRIEGFQSVYDTSQLIFIHADLSKQSGRFAAQQLIQTDATAVFAANDEIAFGLYLGLDELGKSVPKDYSIVGFDNIEMAEYVKPQLTTIAQPIFQLGQTTAQLLIERINQSDKERQTITLPVQLIERFSTAHLK
ncbi:ribose utilization transcriptional repressor RbsR [Atopobacter phocae]|uniref:ribose utilization transcriptional repressor RbsR n=1 Tax=Atopobacter phocae TaxID=136492 RepID=UPI000471B4C9|nr:LacI family DNA-binding transcriptional regulator [Atopobacter phocae]